MQWILHGGSRPLTLSTHPEAPFKGALTITDPASAAARLRAVAHDPGIMKTLRQIHHDLTGINHDSARSRADVLIIAELLDQIVARRLFVFEPHRSHNFTPYLPDVDDPTPWEPSEALITTTTTAPPPPAAPEPTPSPAVLAQAQSLRQAAQRGAPFCEE